MIKLMISVLVLFLLLGCGSSAPQNSANQQQSDDAKYAMEYKGLRFFAQNLPSNAYKLPQVDDATFNALSESKKLQVADKLLSSLFFGYPLPVLKDKIARGDFMSRVHAQLKTDTNDKDAVETYILDKRYFYQARWTNDEVNRILARFYAMKNLDRYFFENWTAYILTQTIMFSPAYELESSHEPNTQRVYNRLVRNLEDQATMSYSTYLHMISDDNWRRFRSPEDNGREMMEIFTLKFDDTLVPVAGKALQNWKLDRDNDTLVIGLNENTKPLQLFGTTIKNGDDFYRELAKSKDFQKGAVSRLTDFFFAGESVSKKTQIIHQILQSNPQTWQDILTQIVFSKAFLLDSDRPKSAEELFYSVTKKMEYKHYQYTFNTFAKALDTMHQASMKYKLGKLNRVPLDTLSFINYHKYIRENVLMVKASADKLNNYKDWGSFGFTPNFIADDRFSVSQDNAKSTVDSLVTYLFESILARDPKSTELALFEGHILTQKDGTLAYVSGLNLLKSEERANAALLILDYISRLSELYQYQKVVL